jgi:DNA-binding winged helix-turn-helix (wHTH) protein
VGRPRLLIDLQSNVVARVGRFVSVEARVAELLHILHAKHPSAVRYDRLIDLLYGSANQPDNPLGCVRTYIYRARQALAQVGGWEVETVRGAYGLTAGGVRLKRIEHRHEAEARAA